MVPTPENPEGPVQCSGQGVSTTGDSDSTSLAVHAVHTAWVPLALLVLGPATEAKGGKAMNNDGCAARLRETAW